MVLWILFFTAQLERLLGFRVTSSPIDDCSTSGLQDDCHSEEPVRGGGGCSNTAVITGEPLLVNTNQTSLVGLDVYIRSECACAARGFTDVIADTQCRADSCFNGGTCYELEYSVTLVPYCLVHTTDIDKTKPSCRRRARCEMN